MFVYRITAFYRDGEETYRHSNTHATRELAEKQVQSEIAAYTYQGMCEWKFKIEEEMSYANAESTK